MYVDKAQAHASNLLPSILMNEVIDTAIL